MEVPLGTRRSPQPLWQHPSTMAACAEQGHGAALDAALWHMPLQIQQTLLWWDAGRDLGAAHSRVIRELGADDRHFDIVVGHFQGALTHLKVDQVCAVMCAACPCWPWLGGLRVLTHLSGVGLTQLAVDLMRASMRSPVWSIMFRAQHVLTQLAQLTVPQAGSTVDSHALGMPSLQSKAGEACKEHNA